MKGHHRNLDAGLLFLRSRGGGAGGIPGLGGQGKAQIMKLGIAPAFDSTCESLAGVCRELVAVSRLRPAMKSVNLKWFLLGSTAKVS